MSMSSYKLTKTISLYLTAYLFAAPYSIRKPKHTRPLKMLAKGNEVSDQSGFQRDEGNTLFNGLKEEPEKRRLFLCETQ